MKLLFLGINYDPEIISTAVYSSGLCDYLANHGVQTKVVTAKPYYPQWRILEGWRGPFWKRRKAASGADVVHCPLYVPRKPTGAKRILHHASFALTAAPVTLWRALIWRPNVVFVVGPSLLAAPVGWLAARIGGAKAWLHIQDFEVEAAFATGLIKEESRTGRAAKAFERWVLRRFDKVSSISRPMLDKLRHKQVPEERIYELRNWANLEKVTPIEGVSPMKAELGIATPYVALYSGNLANKQGLEVLPEMARYLAHRDDVTLLICGDGPMRENLTAMAEGLKSIHFLPLQPLEKLSELLGVADVHLLPQIAGAADLMLPSKLTNMLASGRPVLATAHHGTALGDEIEGAGVLTPPGDGKAAAAALEALLDDPTRRAELGKTARRRALERWDMDAILRNLHIEFEELTGRQAAPVSAE
ncbi:WcaI family glycosyltransferase [Vannielia litorea]|uniref:WcaI family glycosyltransferase n=1 Tax=Vannielia litorea TaxID=1217970 RepID=UPI001BCB9D96|nr:WcaI family glycosyltransferase [Vannielia litorea]MBS8228123.1 colanic acid biosynthesis glycosyltransferase WcaI [Vannielia litorea]